MNIIMYITIDMENQKAENQQNEFNGVQKILDIIKQKSKNK